MKKELYLLLLFFCSALLYPLLGQNVGINKNNPEHLLDIRSDGTPGSVLNLGNQVGDLFFRFNSHNKFSDNPSVIWKTGQSMSMILGSPDGTVMNEFLRFDGKGIGFYNTGSSIFLGENAGLNDDLSDNLNIAIGQDALKTSTNGVNNIAIGDSSLGSTNFSSNIAIGNFSLKDHITGHNNIGIGVNALNSHVSGTDNTAIGFGVLNNDMTSSSNVALGRTVMYTHESGDNNIGIGRSALYYNVTGAGNVAIGHNAGLNETGSNKLYIENSGDVNPLIYGEFDNNLIRVNGRAEVTGRIKVGDDATPPSTGMIRFNSTSGAFEGYNGSAWIPFGVQSGPFGNAQIMNEETDTLQTKFSDLNVNGESISVSGDIMVLGAPNFDENLTNGFGHAIIYKKSNGIWQKIVELSDPANQINSRFGFSVETDGNRIIIGSPGYDDGGNTDEGRVYVYTRTSFGFAWPLTATISSPSAITNQFFGDNVNLNGDDLIIGGPGFGTFLGFPNITCRAFIFKYTSPNWVEQAAFTNSESMLGDGFGADVAIDGDYAIIGAPDQVSRGKAYIFERTGSSWNQVKILNVTDSPSAFGDKFGTSVIIRGTDVVVSAPGYELNGNFSQGQIWGFEKVVNNWLVSFTKTAPEELENCNYGRTMKSFQDKLIVSSGTSKLLTYNKSGSTYTYESTLIKKKLTAVEDFDISSGTVVSVRKFEDLIHFYE